MHHLHGHRWRDLGRRTHIVAAAVASRALRPFDVHHHQFLCRYTDVNLGAYPPLSIVQVSVHVITVTNQDWREVQCRDAVVLGDEIYNLPDPLPT